MTDTAGHTPHFHAVVWIDHREARVFHFNPDDALRAIIHPDNPHQHLHHKSGSIGAGHAGVDKPYLQAVSTALADAGAILVVGPGTAKTEFVAYAKEHAPLVAQRILGTETVDHPSDGQIVAHARKYFRAADRMAPPAP
jgi:stalled ribosome rescue protein Dom34